MHVLCMSSRLWFIQLISIMSLAYCQHRSLFHDRFNTMSSRNSHNFASIISSSKCPSTAYTSLNNIQASKICISNGQNSTYNGQYVWQYDTSNFAEDIHHYINHNTNISLYIHINGSTPYLIYLQGNTQSVVENSPVGVRCNILDWNNFININQCSGNWEHYYFYLKTWVADPDIVSTVCDDICINNSENSFLNAYDELSQYSGPFTYSHYNVTRNGNIYIKLKYNGYVYLYPWIQEYEGSILYSWYIGPDYNSNSVNAYCIVGKLKTFRFDDFTSTDCLYR
eukprot:377335_1